MAVFTTTYRVNEDTGDPFLVQLVGVCFMAPMFLGGVLAGTLTDRVERNRTVALSLGGLIPLAGLMGLLVMADRAPLGISYAFIAFIGVGNVLDMTSRRTIAFGLVGAGLITNAAALETLALHAGNMLGSLTAGALIEATSAGVAYFAVGLSYMIALCSFVASRRAAEPTSVENPGGSGTTPGGDLRAAFGLLENNAVLRQFLMTTVLLNFFYYAFVPLIPAFADELEVGPFATGMLASAVGTGTMCGAFLISRIQPERRGLLHVVGAAGAMAMLLVFANSTWYPLSLAALFIGGLSGSGFGTTQAALVIDLVGEAHRGRALGIMSMAIGSLPFGMLSLGLLARRTDPQMALTISVTIGLGLLFLWHLTRPHLRQL